MSCHDMPAGALSALTNASLAAKRPAIDSSDSAASASVNSRDRSSGVRSSVASKRARSTTSTPTPQIVMAFTRR